MLACDNVVIKVLIVRNLVDCASLFLNLTLQAKIVVLRYSLIQARLKLLSELRNGGYYKDQPSNACIECNVAIQQEIFSELGFITVMHAIVKICRVLYPLACG